MHESNDEKSFRCARCEATFPGLEQLQQHEAEHADNTAEMHTDPALAGEQQNLQFVFSP